MARGDIHREDMFVYEDALTGRKVTRLTSLEHHCHHCYFYQHPFTPDSGRVVYCSDRTGHRNLFLLDLESGESVQLTDAFQLNDFMYEVTPDGKFLYYVEGNQLRKMELDTFRETTVYIQPYPWNRNGIYIGFSDDLKLAVLTQMHADDVIHATEDGWDHFIPQFEARPRCRIVLLDLETGQDTVVHEERWWIGHPQIRPRFRDKIMFCHEGPWNLQDARMWIMNLDGSDRRPVAYWEPRPGAGAGALVGHEYFTPDGKNIAFAHFPEKHGIDGTVRYIDVDTLEETVIGAFHDFNHFFSSPDSRYIVGDEFNRAKRQGTRIWVVDTETVEARPLCEHSSWDTARRNRDTGGFSTQDDHPHPLFSPDGNSVLFTTDRETGPEGNCSVYLAETNGLFD